MAISSSGLWSPRCREFPRIAKPRRVPAFSEATCQRETKQKFYTVVILRLRTMCFEISVHCNFCVCGFNWKWRTHPRGSRPTSPFWLWSWSGHKASLIGWWEINSLDWNLRRPLVEDSGARMPCPHQQRTGDWATEADLGAPQVYIHFIHHHSCSSSRSTSLEYIHSQNSHK